MFTMTRPWGDNVLPERWERSYWQRSVAGEALLNHNEHAPLPESADVVIIGSGLSGAAVAYHLLEASPETRIVCLEAREIGSGASGRNGGHCRPDAFRGFADYARLHGEDEARKIIRSEAITLQKVKEVSEKLGIDCELRLRTTLDLILSEEFERYVDVSFETARKAGVDVSGVTRIGEKESKEITGSDIARGAYVWTAASIHPLKLCLGLHKTCLKHPSYSLYSHCPVTNVKGKVVETPRGSIRAAKIVFATNAYTKLLLPEFDKVIKPWAVQATKLAVPPKHSDGIDSTLSLRFDLNRFYSIAPQPDRSVILGIGPQTLRPEDIALEENMDDSSSVPEISDNMFKSLIEVMPKEGYECQTEPREGEGGYEYSWQGVVGFTPDKVPFVGAVPGHDDVYIIAGMGGHGMARIFHCAPVLASLMNGGAWDEALPSCFQVSRERIERLRG